MAALHDRLGEIELTVKLKRARLNRQRTRGRARFTRFIDNTNSDAELGKPERQNKACGPGTDNQYVALCGSVLHMPFRLRRLHSQSRYDCTPIRASEIQPSLKCDALEALMTPYRHYRKLVRRAAIPSP